MARVRRISLFAIIAICLAWVSALATPPPQPPERHAHFKMPAEIESSAVHFTSGLVQERFFRADAAARKLAGPDWVMRAGKTYTYLSWNGGSDGYSQTYGGEWA